MAKKQTVDKNLLLELYVTLLQMHFFIHRVSVDTWFKSVTNFYEGQRMALLHELLLSLKVPVPLEGLTRNNLRNSVQKYGLVAELEELFVLWHGRRNQNRSDIAIDAKVACFLALAINDAVKLLSDANSKLEDLDGLRQDLYLCCGIIRVAVGTNEVIERAKRIEHPYFSVEDGACTWDQVFGQS